VISAKGSPSGGITKIGFFARLFAAAREPVAKIAQSKINRQFRPGYALPDT
jgi:hypothetical protein